MRIHVTYENNTYAHALILWTTQKWEGLILAFAVNCTTTELKYLAAGKNRRTIFSYDACAQQSYLMQQMMQLVAVSPKYIPWASVCCSVYEMENWLLYKTRKKLEMGSFYG